MINNNKKVYGFYGAGYDGLTCINAGNIVRFLCCAASAMLKCLWFSDIDDDNNDDFDYDSNGDDGDKNDDVLYQRPTMVMFFA